MQFVLHNWYLFVALIVVLVLLAAPTVLQWIRGINSLTPAQCVLLINRQNAVVIDVSEPSEYQSAHIPNAVSAPFATLQQPSAPLDKYKERPVVIVGRNPNRMLRAAAMLRKRGFASVGTLAGGIAAWEKENLPLAR